MSAASGLLIGGLFSLVGAVPASRPTRADVFTAVHADYKLVLNLLAVAVFAGLLALTVRRGATDPVCGMHVDRTNAVTRQVDGRTVYFCSEHCAAAFDSPCLGGREPERPGRDEVATR